MLPKDPKDLKVKPDSSTFSGGESLSLIGLLIVVQIIMGIVCIIGGCIIASPFHYDGTPYIIGGLISGMFMFTLAVITVACKKYLSK